MGSTADRTLECHTSKSIEGCILMWMAVAPALVVAVAPLLFSVNLALACLVSVVVPLRYSVVPPPVCPALASLVSVAVALPAALHHCWVGSPVALVLASLVSVVVSPGYCWVLRLEPRALAVLSQPVAGPLPKLVAVAVEE